MTLADLCLLKLGGSLITDKTQPHTARVDVLARLSLEIVAAYQAQPNLRLVLGHGSGSFGHVPAKAHATRQGVKDAAGWRGFAEVWYEARALNQLVVEALHQAGLPALAFPPSAGVQSADGQIQTWDLTPLKSALQAGLLPVVQGDVVFDRLRGGTICSTEDVFDYLARQLAPRRVLLAGREAGVWADFPACTQLIETITPASLEQVASALHGSAATDVTGGMESKVRQSLALAKSTPGLDVLIFSAQEPGALTEALLGRGRGTWLIGSWSGKEKVSKEIFDG